MAPARDETKLAPLMERPWRYYAVFCRGGDSTTAFACQCLGACGRLDVTGVRGRGKVSSLQQHLIISVCRPVSKGSPGQSAHHGAAWHSHLLESSLAAHTQGTEDRQCRHAHQHNSWASQQLQPSTAHGLWPKKRLCERYIWEGGGEGGGGSERVRGGGGMKVGKTCCVPSRCFYVGFMFCEQAGRLSPIFLVGTSRASIGRMGG